MSFYPGDRTTHFHIESHSVRVPMAEDSKEEMLPSGGAGLDARRSSLKLGIAARRLEWLDEMPRRNKERG